ncbi:MAG: gluconate 2-dehydrogenase subunit 3 family protein [Acidobacteriota bacterium]
MDDRIAQGPPRARRDTPGMTRREALQQVTLLLGGVALTGGDRLQALAFDARRLNEAMVQGTGAFSAADIALLDEIAETILPETSTPGAKAARTGAFMALMVTDAYTERDQQVFRDGVRRLDEACRSANAVSFMQASPAQRLTLLEALDREQRTVTEERANAPRSRAPAAAPAGSEPAHYFRMMKELALLGYFTSEVGYTRAMRYVETPGRFDPCAPHAPGDKTWATHA